jgi:hypothetical protein
MRVRLLISLAALVTLAAPAQAATVSAERTASRACQNGLRAPGTGGIARTLHTVRGNGLTTVTLRGRGDWDVAAYSARGRLLGAATTGSGRERLVVAPASGQRIRIQACRRPGASRTATLTTSFFAVPRGLGVRVPIQQVRVPLVGEGAAARLEATGLDVTHNVTPTYADVILYSAADRAKLLGAGFVFSVLDPDLVASDRLHLLRTPAQQRAAAAGLKALPSGRTAYRAYTDYGTELKAIVAGGAGFARRIEIGRSLEDRAIEGVELATDVERTDDGRPTFLVLGAHHAREWPSAEMPMEFATDLSKQYKAGDERVKGLLDKVRVIVIPIVNPDGFAISRSVPYNEAVDNGEFASLPLALTDSLSYKRKNCRPPTEEIALIPCMARPIAFGVDPNRNYGAYWGGVGSEGTDVTAQDYRGPAPYSEPESEAVHKLSQTRNITTIITHHTYTAEGVWLRQPGFCPFGAAGCQADQDIVPDEAGMKALGDAMADASGWTSQLGWAIGEITGATEDWNYFAASAYGYTPEQRGVNFHPAYEDAVIAEYDGTAEGAKGGVRESLMRAAAQAADRTFHSVIAGSAKPGATLRLKKTFDTVTSVEGVVVKDTLDQTLTVPASGEFVWDVNPSTRPLSGAPEAYTLTCESGEDVLDTKPVTVARGAKTVVDLCGGTTPAGTTPAGATSPTPVLNPATTTTPTTTPKVGLAPAPFSFRLTRQKLTAKIVNKLKRFHIGLTVKGGPITNVTATFKRGKVTAAKGSIKRIGSRSKIQLKRLKRFRRGLYVIEVRGTSPSGRVVRAKKSLRVR